MNKPPDPSSSSASNAQSLRDKQILGLSTDQLGGLSVDEIIGNKTAITMVIHYYKILVDENISLRNDLNTTRTYVDGYEKKKINSAIGAILLTLSNIGLCFGVNLLTADQTKSGLMVFIPFVCVALAGLYFSLKDR